MAKWRVGRLIIIVKFVSRSRVERRCGWASDTEEEHTISLRRTLFFTYGGHHHARNWLTFLSIYAHEDEMSVIGLRPHHPSHAQLIWWMVCHNKRETGRLILVLLWSAGWLWSYIVLLSSVLIFNLTRSLFLRPRILTQLITQLMSGLYCCSPSDIKNYIQG